MKTIDIVLLIILLFGAYRGYRKGFLMEIIAIAALILGIIGGFRLLHVGMEFLDERFDINGTILPYVAFLLIFIAIIILVNLLGKSLKTLIDLTLLGSFDNLAGSLIGILKWAFGISVIFWISGSFNLAFPQETTEGAFIYPLIESFAPTVINGLGYIFPFLEGFVNSVREILTVNP
ncbi:MAG: CvpA family protein [Cyclobacteriaceae bacterium]|nr:CvpA family protein [Cyclobacteriaceae bacterium]